MPKEKNMSVSLCPNELIEAKMSKIYLARSLIRYRKILMILVIKKMHPAKTRSRKYLLPTPQLSTTLMLLKT